MSRPTQQATMQPTLFQQLTTQPPETLPILHQSCLQVLNLTSDKHSSASDVGEVIMHDQALLANIIKIANSPAFQTLSSVKTPTHAVAIIGFDVIRSIVVASQLVEHAQQYGANAECLKQLLARSLVAATAAVELGKAIELKDEGFLFTNAMLYTLGDLVLAFCHPGVFEKLEYQRGSNLEEISTIEIDLIGRPLSNLASAVAKHWHLPDSLTVLLDKKLVLGNCRHETQQKKIESLVYAANELSHCLLSPPSLGRSTRFRRLLDKMPGAFNLTYESVEKATVTAFTKACQFSEVVKIDTSFFIPHKDPNTPAQPPMGQRLIKSIIEAMTPMIEKASTQVIPERQAFAPPHEESHTPNQPSASAGAMMNEFTLKSMQVRDPNALLSMAAQILATTCGFQRVVLTLVSPASSTLEGRIGHGPNVQSLLPLFQCSLKETHFLTKALRQYSPDKIDSFEAEMEEGRLASEFIAQWGKGPCFVGPLFSPTNPIGVLIVDHGTSQQPLTDTHFATFSLILSVVNSNLARLSK